MDVTEDYALGAEELCEALKEHGVLSLASGRTK